MQEYEGSRKVVFAYFFFRVAKKVFTLDAAGGAIRKPHFLALRMWLHAVLGVGALRGSRIGSNRV